MRERPPWTNGKEGPEGRERGPQQGEGKDGIIEEKARERD